MLGEPPFHFTHAPSILTVFHRYLLTFIIKLRSYVPHLLLEVSTMPRLPLLPPTPLLDDTLLVWQARGIDLYDDIAH